MNLYTGRVTTLGDVNYDWRGDFLGFSIGNADSKLIHSSELGIVRISESDRYNEELVPTFNDRTATVPGLDRTYYFGREYTQKNFTIKFAFDNLTEKQLHQLRRIFSKKEPQDLIFDEAPYKIYSVVANGQPQISYICFDENLSRIYKGDGTVNFTTYFPFARSRFKFREDYTIENIKEWGGKVDDKFNWLDGSGITSKKISTGSADYIIDEIIKDSGVNSQSAILCNAGDVATYPVITFSFNNQTVTDNNHTITFNLYKGNELIDPDGTLILDLSQIDGDLNCGYIKIDCEKRLIYGGASSESSLTILNNIIKNGNFFSIPAIQKYWKLTIATGVTINEPTINYDYLYY